ncbi:MAG TPA: glycosyltransferase, partial [Pricia sp.]|nr:glycosyltransferase [Pricia sp.]
MSVNINTIPGINYFDKSDEGILDAIADGMAKNMAAPFLSPSVILTIPAHNEENYIEKCIASIAKQKDPSGLELVMEDFELLILCHNCTDKTYQNAIRMGSIYPTLNLTVLQTKRIEVNNVGAVRRILMRIASSRMILKTGYVAMTDADTLLHPSWLFNLRSYIGSKYGLVCGRITIDTEGLSNGITQILAIKKKYEELRFLINQSVFRDQYEPSPSHCDNSGPNMAVRADVYQEIGGIEPLGFCEDVAFYDKIIWGGYSVRHCPNSIVTTSGRTAARAPWGFGAEISSWDGNQETGPMVEGLDAVLERLKIYSLVGTYALTGGNPQIFSAARLSGIDISKLQSHVVKYGSDRA